MRPNHCLTALHVSTLAFLFLTLNADSEDSECVPRVEVRRYTVYNISIGKELRIKCPVIFCNNTPPKVSWSKIEGNLPFNLSWKSHIKTEWEPSEQSEGAAYLIFKNILNDDAGVYRCEITDTVGHGITVYVSEHDESPSVTQTYDTTQKDSPDLEPMENVLIYVYCAAGITSFVIIVIIISIIAMKGCKRKSKKVAQSENHYMSMPMVEQPVNLHISPRGGSPCVPPSRRSTQRKSPSRQPDEPRSSRDVEQLYDQIKEDRNRQRQAAESGSVVYAALNHELPQRPPARRPRPAEEQSEYAAIRVG